jgi:hypothetical protein
MNFAIGINAAPAAIIHETRPDRAKAIAMIISK